MTALRLRLAAPVRVIGRWRPTAALGRRTGLTDGQVFSLMTILLVTAILSAGGLVPVLRRGASTLPRPTAAAQTDSSSSTPSPELPAARPPREVIGSADAPLGFSAPPGVAADAADLSTTLPPVALFAAIGAPGAPHGLALDGDGRVYVGTDNGTLQGVPSPSQILTFDAAGVAGPTVELLGQPRDHDRGLSGLALDRSGGLLAVDAGTGRLVRFDIGTRSQREVSRVPDVAPCVLVLNAAPCEPGVVDHPARPEGVVVDAGGNVYIADAGQGTIWRVAGGAGPAVPWYQGIDLVSGDGIRGLAVDGESLLLTVAKALDPAARGGGALFRLSVRADGSPGERTIVAPFGADDRPAGVAVAGDRSIAVALRGANVVVVLGPDGAERHRTGGGEGPLALDVPVGVAWLGDRLLVTNLAPRSPQRWAVLTIGFE